MSATVQDCAGGFSAEELILHEKEMVSIYPDIFSDEPGSRAAFNLEIRSLRSEKFPGRGYMEESCQRNQLIGIHVICRSNTVSGNRKNVTYGKRFACRICRQLFFELPAKLEGRQRGIKLRKIDLVVQIRDDFHLIFLQVLVGLVAEYPCLS